MYQTLKKICASVSIKTSKSLKFKRCEKSNTQNQCDRQILLFQTLSIFIQNRILNYCYNAQSGSNVSAHAHKACVELHVDNTSFETFNILKISV